MDHIEIILAEDRGGRKAGEKIQLAVQPIDTYDPTEISSYAAGYRNWQFKAGLVAPELPVDKEVFKFRTFDAADAFQLVNVLVGHEDEPQEIKFRSSLTEARANWRMIGAYVNAITENQAGPNVNPRQASARRIMKAMMLYREVEVFGLLTDPTKWGTNQVATLDNTTKWNGGASRNIYGDLVNMVEDSDQDIDFFTTSRQVANVMLQDSAFRETLRTYFGDAGLGDAFRKTNDRFATDIVLPIPGLPPLHVGNARVRNETTGNNDSIIGDAVIGVVSGPVPTSGEDISTMKTARVRGMTGGENGFISREYDVPGRGPMGGRMLVISCCEKPIFTGNTVGGLLYNVLQ